MTQTDTARIAEPERIQMMNFGGLADQPVRETIRAPEIALVLYGEVAEPPRTHLSGH